MIKRVLEELEKTHEEIDKFFDNFFREEAWKPAVDVYETKDKVILLIELAGVKPEDIQLSIDPHNILHIWGKRQSPLKNRQRHCHSMELQLGTFSRYVRLPVPVNSLGVDLKNNNGIFKLVFKKKVKKVKIKPK